MHTDVAVRGRHGPDSRSDRREGGATYMVGAAMDDGRDLRLPSVVKPLLQLMPGTVYFHRVRRSPPVSEHINGLHETTAPKPCD